MKIAELVTGMKKPPNSRSAPPDTKPHAMQITDSNSPTVGGEDFHKDTLMKVIPNHPIDTTAFGPYFDTKAVVNAINAVGNLQYNNTQYGCLGLVCDCAGAVNQVTQALNGTLQYQSSWDWLFRTDQGYSFEDYYGKSPGDFIDPSAK